MNFRFQERNPHTGLITRWWVDESGRVGVQRVNPAIHDIVDRNKAIQSEMAGKKWGDGKVFASVPLEVVEKELWGAIKANDQKYIKKWLNDSENRDFRRKLGNV